MIDEKVINETNKLMRDDLESHGIIKFANDDIFTIKDTIHESSCKELLIDITDNLSLIYERERRKVKDK